MKKVIFAAIMIFSLIPGIFAASVVEATADVDRTSVKLGETVRYTLTLKRTGDLNTKPTVTLPSFDGFQVAGNYSNTSMTFINGQSSSVVQQIIDLVAVKSGLVVIGPAKIGVVNPQTKQIDTIETKQFTITVGQGGRHVAPSPTPDATRVPAAPTPAPDIRSIKTSLEFRWSDIMPFLILGLILAVILWFAAKAIFKKPGQTAAPAALEEDFRKEAMRRLRAAYDMKKSGEMKDYYYRSYEAVRYFLAKRYGTTMDELTTQEIAAKLREKGAKGEGYNMALSFMKDCDLVKFADYKPTDEEAEALYKTAGDIVNTL
ncbi:MAG: BatD family protein [Spirochaetia bacterium]|nr:BatD family protein [Spirochaetia bacterium]